MYQICVSAAARGISVEEGRELAAAAGKSIALAGHGLMTGATVGLPNVAAESYKSNKGAMSLGISPAASKIEHVMKYRLPTEAYDSILYSGLHYIGRDTLLINSSDAVISIGGRIGTLHEFTIALETNTPIGFIHGAGGISDEIMDILKAAGREPGDNVFFGDTAHAVLQQLITVLDEHHKKYAKLYK
ncbi:MAG: hypothetical protein NTX11_03345 [Candidatus Saccharibacteria bacterium]|nr:hypothetical protein [Candidatus Saccharibacteria bacterium]